MPQILRLALGIALGLTLFAGIAVGALVVVDRHEKAQAAERERRLVELRQERQEREEVAQAAEQERAIEQEQLSLQREWAYRKADRAWRAENRRTARIEAAQQRRRVDAQVKADEAARLKRQAVQDAVVRKSEACSRLERFDC